MPICIRILLEIVETIDLIGQGKLSYTLKNVQIEEQPVLVRSAIGRIESSILMRKKEKEERRVKDCKYASTLLYLNPGFSTNITDNPRKNIKSLNILEL
jgi:hypothetical protein